MSVNIKKLFNGNVYVNGKSFFGAFEEVSLPEIKEVTAEHKSLGMIGKLEYPAGFDKMEAKIKWNGVYNEALIVSGNIYSSQTLMFRGSRETYTANGGRGAQEAVVAYLTGRFKGVPGMSQKPMDNVEIESTMAISSYRMEIAGVEIFDIDFVAQVYRVNGIDLLSQYRANLGI